MANILVITSNTTPSALEQSYINHITGLGHTVTNSTSAAMTLEMSESYDTIFTTPLAGGGVNGITTSKPLICLRYNYSDDLLVAGGGVNESSQTQILIADATHPLAGGLSAGLQTIVTTPVAFSSYYGWPAETAIVARRSSNSSSYVALMELEPGELRTDGSACPGLRILLPFSSEVEISNLTAAGLAILNAAISRATSFAVATSLLSNPVVSNVKGKSASAFVDCSEASGTIYAIAGLASANASNPSAAQIIAGNNQDGSAAPWDFNSTVLSAGTKEFAVTGLNAGSAYRVFFVHDDGAGNYSNVTFAELATKSVKAEIDEVNVAAGIFASVTGIEATVSRLPANGGTQITTTTAGSTDAAGKITVNVSSGLAAVPEDIGSTVRLQLRVVKDGLEYGFAANIVLEEAV